VGILRWLSQVHGRLESSQGVMVADMGFMKTRSQLWV
jgi:hypothetical protein